MKVQVERNRFRWLILISISIMAFIINGDYLAVNLALLPITSELHTNLDKAQWILSGYMLAWATLVIPAGKLLDRYNGKNLCIIGISVFLFSSALAGFSGSINMLIASRMLQGVGGAIFLPTIYSMIYTNFDENECGRAMGLIGLAVGVGLAFGPVIGGFLVTWANWQSIFFINIPIGIIAMLIIYFGKVPATQTSNVQGTNWTSILLIGALSIATLYSMNEWKHWAEHTTFYSVIALAILITLVIFVQIQKRAKMPLIPEKLLRNQVYWGCCLGILLVELSFSTILVITGLYLQNILHLSSLASSNIFLSMTIIFGIIAALGGPWIDRIGLVKPTIIGLEITACAVLFFALISGLHNLWLIAALFMTMGIGLGLSFTALNTGIVKTVDESNIGIASSIFLMITLLGNAIGVAAATIIYEYFSLGHLLNNLNAQGYLLNLHERKQLAQHIASVGGGGSSLDAFSSAMQSDILSSMTSALNSGVNSAMLIDFVLSCGFIFICARLMKRSAAAP
jgi:MFS family permease